MGCLNACSSSIGQFSLGFHLGAPDGCQYTGRLLAAHDSNARVRPAEQEVGIVGAATHAVIAGAVGVTDDQGQLRYPSTGNGGNQLGAVFGDAAGFVFLANHEPRDVLQEQKWNPALGTEFDKCAPF